MPPTLHSVSSVLLVLVTAVHLPSYPLTPDSVRKMHIEYIGLGTVTSIQSGAPNWLGLVSSPPQRMALW